MTQAQLALASTIDTTDALELIDGDFAVTTFADGSHLVTDGDQAKAFAAGDLEL